MKIDVYFKKGKGVRTDAHIMVLNKSCPEGFSTDSADFDKIESTLTNLFGSPRVGSYRCEVLEDGHPGVLMQIRPAPMSKFAVGNKELHGIKDAVKELKVGEESGCYRIETV